MEIAYPRLLDVSAPPSQAVPNTAQTKPNTHPAIPQTTKHSTLHPDTQTLLTKPPLPTKKSKRTNDLPPRVDPPTPHPPTAKPKHTAAAPRKPKPPTLQAPVLLKYSSKPATKTPASSLVKKTPPKATQTPHPGASLPRFVLTHPLAPPHLASVNRDLPAFNPSCARA